jgi:hypothetical protein
MNIQLEKFNPQIEFEEESRNNDYFNPWYAIMQTDTTGDWYRVSDVDKVLKELQDKISELENKVEDLELDLDYSEHGTP